MEIKLKSNFRDLILIIVMYMFNIAQANDANEIEINFVNTETLIVNVKKSPTNEKLIPIDIPNKKILTYINNNLIEVNKDSTANAQNSLYSSEKSLVLEPREYIEIKGSDNRTKLFDGTIIIKFNEMPDLTSFAATNNLLFVTDLSKISRGVFKVSNLYELEDKIRDLKSDKNILNIDLDTIDPSIKNQ
ncbi:hypothetical protein [Reinekea sp.]|uniref:hypothetical protein n=1 Tax=Reinekea sp. TaxID=1970455 RepID=UPI00257D49BD|nr:hypothetical protein [Reinekea sp.]